METKSNAMCIYYCITIVLWDESQWLILETRSALVISLMLVVRLRNTRIEKLVTKGWTEVGQKTNYVEILNKKTEKTKTLSLHLCEPIASLASDFTELLFTTHSLRI